MLIIYNITGIVVAHHIYVYNIIFIHLGPLLLVAESQRGWEVVKQPDLRRLFVTKIVKRKMLALLNYNFIITMAAL